MRLFDVINYIFFSRLILINFAELSFREKKMKINYYKVFCCCSCCLIYNIFCLLLTERN